MKILKTIMMSVVLIITLLLASCNNQSQNNESQGENSVNESTTHVHNYSEYVTEIEPSCKTLGKEVATCSCGSKKKRTLLFTSHQYSEWSITKPATCSEIGEKVKVCALCGDEVRTSISATGHQFGEWVIEKEANCIEQGNKKRVCSACGAVENESIPAHNYVEISRKDATCESTGYIEYKCDRCGDKHKETVQAIGHNWQSATCTAPKKCKACGKTDGKALGHTCKSGTQICSRCGKNVANEMKIELPSTPITLAYKYSNNKTITRCEITDISYKIESLSNLRIYFTFTGKKTYDYENGDNIVKFIVKLYDDEGFLVNSTTAYIQNLNVGDKFKYECNGLTLDDDWASHTTYTLVLEDND